MKNTSILHAAAMTMAVALFCSTQVNAAETKTFDIPAGDLTAALEALARQTAIELVYKSDDIRGLKTQGVRGNLSPQEAVAKLIDGTRLTITTDSAGAILISAATPSPVEPVKTTAQVPENSEMRLVQAGNLQNANSPGAPGASENKSENKISESPSETSDDKLQEITVTGSSIRGGDPANVPLITITREEIDRSGAATTHDLMDALPQNFGGAREETQGGLSPLNAGGNLTFSSTVNLRGLGADSTLVLLNGRRMAPSGNAAGFVDISAIPLSAVQRVEVLTDGASAIYGSDAVGGVVNFILRENYDGAETSVRYGSVTDGRADERQISQLLGKHWTSGNALLMYEFYDRGNLAAEDRAFASNSDLRSLGGSNFSTTNANPGNITRGTQTFAIPSGQDGSHLTTAALLPGVINFQNQREQTDLLPEQKQNSLLLSSAQKFGDRIEGFASGGYAKRYFTSRATAAEQLLSVPATNPFYVNPFGGTANISVGYSFLDDLGPQVSTGDSTAYNGLAGIRLDMGTSWRAELYGSYSRAKENLETINRINMSALNAALASNNSSTAFNPFGEGSHTNPATLASISNAYLRSDTDSAIRAVQMRADGDLFAVPGGVAKLALGLEAQKNSYDLISATLSTGTTPVLTPTSGERKVYSMFSELYLPLVGTPNQRSGIKNLGISLAARFDHYTDFGSTLNPKMTLGWQPIEVLTFRGTIGTSFKAPLLTQLAPLKQVLSRSLPNPAVGGNSNAVVLLGTRPDLQPEESTVWTAGFELKPERLAGFSARLDYFNIDLRDRIRLPASNTTVLLSDPVYASLVTSTPSVADVLALYAEPIQLGVQVPAAQVAAIIDNRLSNVSSTKVSGLDLLLTQDRDVKLGSINLKLNASYMFDHKVAITSSAPLTGVVNTLGNPLKLRLHSAATWMLGGISTSVALSYSNSYTEILSNPARQISSWTVADLQLSYRIGTRGGRGWIDDTRIALNCANVLDREPPFANLAGVGYDAINANARGRFISLQATKQW